MRTAAATTSEKAVPKSIELKGSLSCEEFCCRVRPWPGQVVQGCSPGSQTQFSVPHSHHFMPGIERPATATESNGCEFCARSSPSAGRRHTNITQPKINLFMISSPLLRQAIIKSGVMRAASDELASRLAALCEQFYLNREIESLTEAAELLINLPNKKAQAAGKFYLATQAGRRGDLHTAIALLESVARCESTPRYQARALQSLGIAYRYLGDRKEARRLYERAISHAVSLPQQDYITIIRAGITVAELHGSEGDHREALKYLRAIRPAVETVSRISPVYASLWANDVAIDLAGLGKLEEASHFARLAVSSPVANRYPEWLETAREIEEAREAKAAPNLCPAVQQARKTSIKPKLRPVKRLSPAAFKLDALRRTRPSTVIRPERPRSKPTLEQLSLKVRIRAPSPHPFS